MSGSVFHLSDKTTWQTALVKWATLKHTQTPVGLNKLLWLKSSYLMDWNEQLHVKCFYVYHPCTSDAYRCSWGWTERSTTHSCARVCARVCQRSDITDGIGLSRNAGPHVRCHWLGKKRLGHASLLGLLVCTSVRTWCLPRYTSSRFVCILCSVRAGTYRFTAESTTLHLSSIRLDLLYESEEKKVLSGQLSVSIWALASSVITSWINVPLCYVSKVAGLQKVHWWGSYVVVLVTALNTGKWKKRLCCIETEHDCRAELIKCL